jgi:heme-degrading monooxygenase HmoA
MSKQITTISFFQFDSIKTKIWAFGMMQYGHPYLAKVEGMSFYKLMGSGKGFGFNPFPDWSTYCLLQVWDSEEDANAFFKSSELFQKYKANTKDFYTLYLKNLRAHGLWSSKEPFIKNDSIEDDISYVAVITRAKIKLSKLWTFWRYVPTSQKPLINNKDLIYTKGIGEVPVIQMATFSLWKDAKSIDNYAYNRQEHIKAIQLTKQHNWYTEELFSRFQPYKTYGSYNGRDLLPELEKITLD